VKKRKKIKIWEKPLRDYYGYAYPETGEIIINSKLKGKALLGTYIHEIMHILYPGASERMIAIESNIMTKHLWEKGYRKVK
tara:strand:- start:4199 stop:4441 length:243 start_codon:yes stop_codon:yes gene_type:complete